ncbi:hypothetical protein Vadar_021843 [Vaccinium darrowii]|uniref:Uncharacterized protein n=1 Tax=Vaccinium darrowii TaxID=229202 RepID=A0ACB7XJ38_9ERIC|nr:hypothetical protein Vadar_021843 [Vaccinium darrowii]
MRRRQVIPLSVELSSLDSASSAIIVNLLTILTIDSESRRLPHFFVLEAIELLSASGLPLNNCYLQVNLSLYLVTSCKGTGAFCSGGDQALRNKDGYADYENIGRPNVPDVQGSSYPPTDRLLPTEHPTINSLTDKFSLLSLSFSRARVWFVIPAQDF